MLVYVGRVQTCDPDYIAPESLVGLPLFWVRRLVWMGRQNRRAVPIVVRSQTKGLCPSVHHTPDDRGAESLVAHQHLGIPIQLTTVEALAVGLGLVVRAAGAALAAILIARLDFELGATTAKHRRLRGFRERNGARQGYLFRHGLPHPVIEKRPHTRARECQSMTEMAHSFA